MKPCLEARGVCGDPTQESEGILGKKTEPTTHDCQGRPVPPPYEIPKKCDGQLIEGTYPID